MSPTVSGLPVRMPAARSQVPQAESRQPVRWTRPDPVTAAIVIMTALGLALRLYQLSRPDYLIGVTEYDDGTDFGSAVLLIHGDLPYRDFVMVQPPGITLLMAPVALVTKGIGTAWGIGVGRIHTALAGAAAVAMGGLLVRLPGAPGRHRHLRDPGRLPGRGAGRAHRAAGALAGAVLPGRDAGRVRPATGCAGTRRLVWGGVAFGFAGAIKVWAILPVLVILVLILAARQPRPSRRRRLCRRGDRRLRRPGAAVRGAGARDLPPRRDRGPAGPGGLGADPARLPAARDDRPDRHHRPDLHAGAVHHLAAHPGPDHRHQRGRLAADQERPPLLEQFKPLADYVHGKGLKFGIHIMRGIPRKAVDANLPVFGSKLTAADVANKQSICRWNSDMYGVDVTKGGQAYYDSIVQLYTSWGLDFIKADDMFGFGDGGDHSSEIDALNKSIAKYGRPIVLSLSPGTRDAQQSRVFGGACADVAHFGRFLGSLGGSEEPVRTSEHLEPVGPPGPLARRRHASAGAHRTARRARRSAHVAADPRRTDHADLSLVHGAFPLMFGGNLPDNDAFTLSLMTNDEVLAVDQKAESSRQLFSTGNQVAWVADLPGSKVKYVAVFNIGDTDDERIRVNWQDLGLSAKCAVRDLWAHADTGTVADGSTFAVKPHAAGFYRITPVR